MNIGLLNPLVTSILKRLGLLSASGANATALGPASATQHAIAAYADSTGKALKSTSVTIADTTGLMTTGQGRVPVVLTRSVTSAQTGANTNETTLWSYSLPAGTLASDGQGIRIKVWGTLAANTNSKTVRLKFGGTTLRALSGITSASITQWSIEGTVLRTGATSQTGQAFGIAGFGPNTYVGVTSPGETLANAVTIALTGQNGTDNAGDITFRGAIVEFLP